MQFNIGLHDFSSNYVFLVPGYKFRRLQLKNTGSYSELFQKTRFHSVTNPGIVPL